MEVILASDQGQWPEPRVSASQLPVHYNHLGELQNLLILRSYLQRFLFNCSGVQPGMRIFSISPGLLVPWDCHNKLPQIWYFKGTEMYSLRVLEARHLKLNCGRY